MVSYSEQIRPTWAYEASISDYRAAVMMKNREHHEPGESIEEPIQQRRILAFISKFQVVVRIRMEL